MKRSALIIFLMLLTLSSTAHASPYLVCDPSTGVEHYEITGLPAPLDGSNVQAQADGSIKMDLAQCPVGGPYSISVKACNVWGCSQSSPFGFTRPEALSGVQNIRLTK